MKIKSIMGTLLLGMAAMLATEETYAQCSANHYECQAAVKCFTGSYSGWGAVGLCTDGNTDVCQAWRWVNGEGYVFQCSTVASRGASDDPLDSIFKAGQEVRDGNGKLVEIDQTTGELIQVATSINALQARGAPIGKDVNAAFKDAGIPVVDSVSVDVADDSETGERQFTLRGANSDDPVVLRFDERGQAIQEEQGPPPPEVMEKIEAMKRGND